MSRDQIITPSFLRDWPLPPPGGGKGSRGRVLVVGGSRKVPGAAQLSGLAALRVGAGVLTMAVAKSVAVALAVATPEAGTIGLAEDAKGSVTGDGVGDLEEALSAVDGVLIGPGLDAAEPTVSLLRALVPRIPSDVPVILDAFALGVLADNADLAETLRGRLILTPNAAEAGRLIGGRAGDVTDNDVAEVAKRFEAVVVCGQLVINPAGDRWRGSSGFGGLGTSGSGDVLAGAICGLVARGATLEQASCWGTHLHSTAGDRLAIDIGPLGFLARELLDRLPAVMAELTAR